MGLLYLNNKEKQLYSAYGLTVYGRQDRYEWTIYNNKPDENVYTSLRIERNGEEIYNRNLGNRCIFEENFNRTIDNFYGGLIKIILMHMTLTMQLLRIYVKQTHYLII